MPLQPCIIENICCRQFDERNPGENPTYNPSFMKQLKELGIKLKAAACPRDLARDLVDDGDGDDDEHLAGVPSASHSPTIKELFVAASRSPAPEPSPPSPPITETLSPLSASEAQFGPPILKRRLPQLAAIMETDKVLGTWVARKRRGALQEETGSPQPMFKTNEPPICGRRGSALCRGLVRCKPPGGLFGTVRGHPRMIHLMQNSLPCIVETTS